MAGNRVSNTNWNFIKILGSGAFGEVCLWERSDTRELVAIKQCLVDQNNLNQDENVKLNTRWQQEAVWMSELDEVNIVRACPDRCRDLLEEINSKSRSHLPAIAMEYCEGGNLRTKLQHAENINGLTEYDVREVLRAVGNAIHYLHGRNITHRDIKPDNIVLKNDGSGKTIYKLTDMGYARIIDSNTIEASKVGTKNYFAPEIVDLEFPLARYTNTVDYWSTGVLAFEIMCGVYPFLHGGGLYEVVNAVNEKPSGCIAITMTDGSKEYHHDLFPENRLSSEFQSSILPWLRSALEKDGRTRGYNQFGKLTFFSELQSALDRKILSVFWLNRCKPLSYSLDNSSTMDILYTKLEGDTGVSRFNTRFIFPMGHSLHHLSSKTLPIELINEGLAAENKPMLYVFTLEENGLCNPEEPYISMAIKKFFVGKAPMRPQCIEQLQRNVLYVYQNGMKIMNTYYDGVVELAMSLEHELVIHKKRVQEFNESCKIFAGRAGQYEIMVNQGKALLEVSEAPGKESKINEWEVAVQNFNNFIAENSNIFNRYTVLLTSIREFLKLIQSPLLPEQLQRADDHIKSFKSSRCIESTLGKDIAKMLELRGQFFEITKQLLRKNVYSLNSAFPEPILQIWIDSENVVKNAYDKQSVVEDYQKFIASSETAILSEQMDTLDISSISTETLLQENATLRERLDRLFR